MPVCGAQARKVWPNHPVHNSCVTGRLLLLFVWASPADRPADCKRGRKKGAARKLSKSVEKLFDTFWRFLTFFALRENCRKVSKNFLTLFDDFWRFLTWPLSAGPFCNPLLIGLLHLCISQKVEVKTMKTFALWDPTWANLRLRSSSPATGVIWALRAQMTPKKSPKMGSRGLSAPGVEKGRKRVEKESKIDYFWTFWTLFRLFFDFFDPRGREAKKIANLRAL